MTRIEAGDREAVARARRTGSPSNRIEPTLLRAGAVSVYYDSGFLRYLHVGGKEAIRRIYFAVRDRNWDTIPGVISNETVTAQRDSFEISFVSSHRQDRIDFVCTAVIRGNTDGEISFSIEGEALSSFLKNRIGLCILHPMDVAACPCSVVHNDGSEEDSRFPNLISPHQPFLSIRSIRHTPAAGYECEVKLDGDIFEMEDQRNWTDGSFKIYSTPLALPFPVLMEAGDRIAQRVTVRPIAEPGVEPIPRSSRNGPVSLNIVDSMSFQLPGLGFEVRPGEGREPEGSTARMKALAPDHLRLEVEPSSQSDEEIESNLREAGSYAFPLEVALFLSKEREIEIKRFARVLRKAGPRLKRILLLEADSKVTSAETLRLAALYLRVHLPEGGLCGGTDSFFAELNRDRLDTALVDGLCFSINPQVHTFDNCALVETLAAQQTAVESAEAFSRSRAVHVSPVTLRMRWNPNATSPSNAEPEERLIRRVDPRQFSLFGAAWTVGSIRSLSMGGASSVTYYETVGPLGLVEDGQPVAPFPPIASGVFPLYYVFLELAPFHGGRVLPTQSSDPLVVEALAVTKEEHTLTILTNYCAAALEVQLGGVERNAGIRYLSGDTYEQYSRDPERYLQSTIERRPRQGQLSLSLPPNGVAFVSY